MAARWHLRSEGRWSVVLALLLITAAAGIWQFRGSRRFPKPSAAAAPPTALAVRPPRPLSPSIPGLEYLAPRPVPGLDELRGAFSPCLAADLKTIVFANWKSRVTEYDLYLATRDAVDQPFGEPRLIDACVTAWTDAFPALSADGLELFYISVDDAHPGKPPKLLYSARVGLTSPFFKPSEVKLPGFDGARQRMLSPQLVDSRRLKVSVADSNTQHSLRVATRSGDPTHFVAFDALAMENAWPLWWLSSDALRAYGGVPEGVCLSYRRTFDEGFGAPAVVASTDRLGGIDGPIWMAPKEDVCFYCSAGPGKPPGEGRYLWMVAF